MIGSSTGVPPLNYPYWFSQLSVSLFPHPHIPFVGGWASPSPVFSPAYELLHSAGRWVDSLRLSVGLMLSFNKPGLNPQQESPPLFLPVLFMSSMQGESLSHPASLQGNRRVSRAVRCAGWSESGHSKWTPGQHSDRCAGPGTEMLGISIMALSVCNNACTFLVMSWERSQALSTSSVPGWLHWEQAWVRTGLGLGWAEEEPGENSGTTTLLQPEDFV